MTRSVAGLTFAPVRDEAPGQVGTRVDRRDQTGAPYEVTVPVAVINEWL
jgi:hypothetical protein